MVYENEPRWNKNAPRPDWRLKAQETPAAVPADDIEYVVEPGVPPADRAGGSTYRQPHAWPQPGQGLHPGQASQPGQGLHPGQGPQQASWPQSSSYPVGPPPPVPTMYDPAYTPGPPSRGSFVVKLLCWLVLVTLSGLTFGGAIVVAGELDQEFVARQVTVVSTATDITCELTVETDDHQRAVVETWEDCVDAPKVGERLSAHLPVDGDGHIDDGGDDLTYGYLGDDKPAVYGWAFLAIMAVGWLAFGIAAIRYLWVNRTR